MGAKSLTGRVCSQSNKLATRHRFMCFLFLLLVALSTLVRAFSSHQMARQHMLVGGYSGKIHLLAFEQDRLHLVESFPSGNNPTFLLKHPHLKDVIYASNEVDDGTVDVFQFDPHRPCLTPLARPVSTDGAGPAAVSVHPTGSWLFVANYGGGSYGVVAIDQHHDEQGLLVAQRRHTINVTAEVDLNKLRRNNNPRQEAPHPHQIITDSSGKFVFVCDLGLDKIHTLVLDVENGNLKSVSDVAVEPGSGPRHMIFSRDEKFAYVINELANTVSQFEYDRQSGGLSFLQSWSTLDESVKNKSACAAAELALSPDERFLYASNRGDEEDSIAVFSVDGDGALTLLGLDRVGGSWPRHFAFDRSGQWVVVGVERSNKVNLLRRNEETGRLSGVICSVDDVQSPAFIQFI